MRRWFAILLLVFLPLQITWAAVSPYCQHEKGTTTKHFGHHEHQHKAADGKEVSPDSTKLVADDPDCASCHAGCVSALPVAASAIIAADPTLGIANYRAHFPSPPQEPLERPQWRVLA